MNPKLLEAPWTNRRPTVTCFSRLAVMERNFGNLGMCGLGFAACSRSYPRIASSAWLCLAVSMPSPDMLWRAQGIRDSIHGKGPR